MSPSSKLALDVTWTWPVVILLLFFALMPLYGPLMPTVEGRFFPVTTKITFVNPRPTDGGTLAQMSYVKSRDCELLGVSADDMMSGQTIEFHAVVGTSVGTWATGPHISVPWFIGAPSITGLRVRWVHRCNPLWLTVTQAYP